MRDLMEAIRLADQVGLDYFGIGERHTATMPISSPASAVNAAAACTGQIRLGSTVSVLSTDNSAVMGGVADRIVAFQRELGDSRHIV